MPPKMWNNNHIHSSTANYKQLKTGTLNPHITNAMKYSQLAQKSMTFRRFPIIGLKNPNTGTPYTVINSTIKNHSIKNRITTKIFCIQYIQ